jgi:hemoglobin-like flavoprotein
MTQETNNNTNTKQEEQVNKLAEAIQQAAENAQVDQLTNLLNGREQSFVKKHEAQKTQTGHSK